VRIATALSGERVTIEVADDGPGMSPAFIAGELFKPFRSTKSHGLGIGMYQCKMIVESHGGFIQVESLPGNGSLIRVSLPLKPSPSNACETLAADRR
jgi:signal transduction histidine kinase